MKKNNKGFSLIELIIAVAILVVLSGLLAPQLIKYVERSREAKDVQMLDSIYVAVNTALTNEEAYNDFVDNSAASKPLANISSGMDISAIMAGSTTNGLDFVKEVKSIIGKEDTALKLNSKRAKGTAGTNKIYVKVGVKKGDDNVEGLEVGVYAGSDASTPVAGFTVGTVN